MAADNLESADEGTPLLGELDFLGEPDGEPGGVIPVVQQSCIGGHRGRGLFTPCSGPPAPVELVRDGSFGAAEGLLTDEEGDGLFESKAPEYDYLVCLVFGGKLGYLRDELSTDHWGELRPLVDTLDIWLGEGRCAQEIPWDENSSRYFLHDQLRNYVSLRDPTTCPGAMANDALYGCCKTEAEYEAKDLVTNNLVMVPCARPARSDSSKVEFTSMWLYPRKGWYWDLPQELTLGYGWEEVDPAAMTSNPSTQRDGNIDLVIHSLLS
eukprot:TRINITY_DN52312_c0_g1_i1.p1 TRINITY_DN52312_c0_g1~~TRINITY_DN52312_c0_g1_i1.p1  ORF type:complete len:267 (+),score=26.28 TRINITY_DN52312_c0_g1_i1:37-837(+)